MALMRLAKAIPSFGSPLRHYRPFERRLFALTPRNFDQLSHNFNSDVQGHGNQRTWLLGSPRDRGRSGSETVCDEPRGSTSCRTIDSASRRGARLAAAGFRMMEDRTATGESRKASSLSQNGSAQATKKCLPLLLGQKLEEPRHREQEHLRIAVV